jgi:hypothetical protein
MSFIEKENWKVDQKKVRNTFIHLLKYNNLMRWKLTQKKKRLGKLKPVHVRKGNIELQQSVNIRM